MRPFYIALETCPSLIANRLSETRFVVTFASKKCLVFNSWYGCRFEGNVSLVMKETTVLWLDSFDDMANRFSKDFLFWQIRKNWYNSLMQIIMDSLALISHMIFIGIFFHLLTHLVDWSKYLKVTQETTGQVKLFVLLLSVVLGYLASRFVLEVIALSQAFGTMV